MLQVALAPAAVTFRIVNQGGWQLLVTAPQFGRDPDLPSRLPQQRGLNRVVTENLAAKGFPARQFWQAAVLDLNTLRELSSFQIPSLMQSEWHFANTDSTGFAS